MPLQTKSIHRQQLFHWIGDDLDRANRGRVLLRDGLVDEYIKRLDISLDSGIWVSVPRKPESFIFGEKQFSLQLPIACFTEWPLGESGSHVAKYGRMGFGFPKRWVIERGGQSVSYFNHKQKSVFMRKISRLLSTIGMETETGAWRAKDGGPAIDDLAYILHFAKMIRAQKAGISKKTTGRRVAKKKAQLSKRIMTQAMMEAIALRRRFGQPLPFVEEREWRIVYNEGAGYFKEGPGRPRYYLPYTPGEDLFTLVLPDNKVVNKVRQITRIADKLFEPWKVYKELNGCHVPPVTVLAHCDIGTF